MYEGKLIRLRALRPEDAELNARWMSDRDTRLLAGGGGTMPIAEDMEREWIISNRNSVFAIETLSEPRQVGVCSFFDVHEQAGWCKLGIFIGEKADRGRGYGGDALRTLLKFLFVDKNMHRAELQVYSYNVHAIKLYEKLGFVREVTEREQVWAMGKYWDEYSYSILQSEYLERYGDK